MNVSRSSLPEWAKEMVALYESDAASQFILHGNIHDRHLIATDDGLVQGTLMEFLLRVLMPQFEVILSYDLGNGLRVQRGGERFKEWPAFQVTPEFPRAPRPAIELVTRYLRYCANLARIGSSRIPAGVILESAQLIAPVGAGILNYDLNALALLLRDWASDSMIVGHPLVSVLLAENLNDLHPLIVNNPRVAKIRIPLPPAADLQKSLETNLQVFPRALENFAPNLNSLAQALTGVTLTGLDKLLHLREYEKKPIGQEDLAAQKRCLVEDDCQGLIEFIEPRRKLDDLYGQERLKAWLRQDLALWQKNDLQALPMGYLICGPVGTGKTYLVECLAGEAGVPVVKIKNFRDRWVGSTEGNLEKIFRLLQALQRCYVFVDEADQALGRRDRSGQDNGLSGRVYSMIATEMSRSENRGRLVWVLASSRPDLIEVDLKRPGRVDLKIPIFPAATRAEAYGLLRGIARRYQLELPSEYDGPVPDLLTPGAAEALIVKVYRTTRTTSASPAEALTESLRAYRSPISPEVLAAQIRLALAESSDLEFVPPEIRSRFGS